jgi:hypothetical protein
VSGKKGEKKTLKEKNKKKIMDDVPFTINIQLKKKKKKKNRNK